MSRQHQAALQFATFAVLLPLVLSAAALSEAIPRGYEPELHPTLMEEVSARRRLARGAGDELTQAAGKAAGAELDFCIRLQRNMRRCVQPAPEGDWGHDESFHTAHSGSLQELRLYGSVNRSERSGTAVNYRRAGRPLYLGVGRAGEQTAVVVFSGSGSDVRILDQALLEEQFWSQCFVLDLTGDGLIDVALSYGHGVSGGGWVSVFSVGRDGSLSRTLELRSAQMLLSVVDLNHDGIWELETSRYVTYDGAASSYRYNVLHSAATGSWRAITDRNRHAFRLQRRFYQQYLADNHGNDAEEQAVPNQLVERLLRSWDRFAAD